MTKKSVDIAGLKKGEAMEALIRAGYGFAEAEKYWKDNGAAPKVGFAAAFYAELEKGPMAEDEFNALIDANSANVQRHRSHYNNIRALANAIWESKRVVEAA